MVKPKRKLAPGDEADEPGAGPDVLAMHHAMRSSKALERYAAEHEGSVNLRNALLQSCNLEAYNFANCDLRGARFEKSILKGTDFTGANLTGAHLEGAILQDAICFGADLTGVHAKGAMGLDGVKTDRKTKWSPVDSDKALGKVAAPADRVTIAQRVRALPSRVKEAGLKEALKALVWFLWELSRPVLAAMLVALLGSAAAVAAIIDRLFG